MPSTTPKEPPKKNKGGRPRKDAKGSPGAKHITWKTISDPPGGLNHYEISSRGEVRRKLKDGRYTPVKAWVTGGPYAAVYLYGFPRATRHRKKCYIHRLVATHFVKGRKKGEVVHHKQGPANNSASALEWVSVDENAKARKYFASDGTRKEKVKDRIHSSNANNKKEPPQKKNDDDRSLEEDKLPKMEKPEVLPGRDEYIPNTETLAQKIKYLLKNSKEFKNSYLDVRKVVPNLSPKSFAKLYREATGKAMRRFKEDWGPYKWKSVLLSAFQTIKTRLKT